MVAPEQYGKSVVRGEWRSLAAANSLLGTTITLMSNSAN